MASVKRIVREVLDTLPDDCSLQDVADRLHVRQGAEEAERDAEGRRLDDEVMRQARMYREGQPALLHATGMANPRRE